MLSCRNCGADGDDLEIVLDLGSQYLSDFREDESLPPKHPLELVSCSKCGLAQLSNTAPSEQLYHPNYSFKSGISPAIGKNLKSVVEYGLDLYKKIHGEKKRPSRWLDIASNDGTLLSFVPQTTFRVGIDPLKQFAEEARTHADEIISDFFSADKVPGRYDIITSVSMFYDLDDPNAFVQEIDKALAHGGIWLCQQNQLGQMLDAGSFDNVSHEHLCYWDFNTFEPLIHRHGFELVGVWTDPINGGCFGVAAVRTADGVLPGVWDKFRKNYETTIAELQKTVGEYSERGELAIYGASTRGGVIWQAAGLGKDQISYVVERNPDKVGRYMSAIGVPIISEEDARERRPVAMLVGPWWLKEDIIEREQQYLDDGGALIFPLPTLEIVTK